MKTSTIYSIGHGNKTLKAFIAELNAFDIKYLLDIRSKPYSKWSPHFNQAQLKMELERCGIRYIYAGDSLGGLPNDRSCYDNEGKILYDVLKEKDFFKQGLERLIIANEKEIRLAIMCSEAKPEECHRSKLIGEELRKKEVPINHIIAENKLKSQETTMYDLTKGYGMVDLFGNKLELKSRKSY